MRTIELEDMNPTVRADILNELEANIDAALDSVGVTAYRAGDSMLPVGVWPEMERRFRAKGRGVTVEGVVYTFRKTP